MVRGRRRKMTFAKKRTFERILNTFIPFSARLWPTDIWFCVWLTPVLADTAHVYTYWDTVYILLRKGKSLRYAKPKYIIKSGAI